MTVQAAGGSFSKLHSSLLTFLPGADVDLAGHGGGDQGGAAWVEAQ